MMSRHTLPFLAMAALSGEPALARDQAAPVPPPSAAAAPGCTPEHAAMGHCTLPASPQRSVQQRPALEAPSACSPEHAAMGHCTLAAPARKAQPRPAAPVQPACPPEHAAMGHCTPTPPATGEGTDPPAGSDAAPPVPSDFAANAIYGPSAMAMGRHHLFDYHGGQTFFMAILDIAEIKVRDGRDGFVWKGGAWYGGDSNRLVVKTEGEGELGAGLESGEVQVLYSRAVDPHFDFQAGLRYDFEPDPSRVYATIGFEGLAPGFLEVEGALFLSDRGELLGRLEGHYDQRVTQRLILQPRAEFNFAAQSTREIDVGAGLIEAELGLRLRYEVTPEFSPYLGVQYERAFGKTREFLRGDGGMTGGLSFLAGIRAWF